MVAGQDIEFLKVAHDLRHAPVQPDNAFARDRISDPLRFRQTIQTEFQARNRLGAIINSSLRRVLGSGWSKDELWQDGKQSVVWAEGLRSEMNAFFPSTGGYRWRLKLFPHNGRGFACQVVEVKVNQTSVVKILLEQRWHWYEFDVPAGLVHSGDNQLQFLFHFAASPRSHRGSPDDRPLSVAFDLLEAVAQN